MTKQPRIALAMIVKSDEEVDELHRALNSAAKHVDGIFITVTNPGQKKIEKLCKEFNAHLSYFEWVMDFSKARNFSFDQVTDDYTHIFWMDADDMLQGGESLRGLAQESLDKNLGAIFARYLYSCEFGEQGEIKNILIEHLRERLILNNHTYKWVAPIHETLIAEVPQNQTDTNLFLLVHVTDLSKMENSMYRNIEILQNEVMNNPTDPRPIYYLAKAYFDTKDPMVVYDDLGDGVESITIELIKDYLVKSGWAEERAQALEYLSMLYREMGKYDKAIQCLMTAQVEWPQYPSIYIQLALCYVMIKDWSKAMHWVKVAMQLDIPKTTLVIQPKDYKMMMLEVLFHIYFNTQNLDLTEKTIDKLVEIMPTDVNIGRQMEVKNWKAQNDLAHWVIKLGNHLSKTGQKGKLKALVNAIPDEIDSAPALVQMRNDLTPPREWESNEIAIYCGPGFEKWSPANESKGIGGSEEAVINMGRELTKLGWKVTVFGDPQEMGSYEGVDYLPYYYANFKDSFNVFIAWRNIGLFDLNLKTKKAYLWNHDLQNSMTYTPERLKKIDKVFFLSKFHRTNVPALDESKIMYTHNGI
jgi:tetratricopeptide (TPR) repeat protein